MNDSEKTTGSLALKPKPQIITIPATGQDLTRPLRVAAYARVSSDSNDQLHSYAAQTAYFAKLINSNPNWIFADIYADQGITGTSVEKRDDFLRMMEDCRSGRIDRILVKFTSRFARNTKESLEAVRELKSLGVSVYFEEQNIDTAQATGEALTAVFSALAQKESEAISERMRHSYQMRMQRGVFSTRCAPYGYQRILASQDKALVAAEIQTTEPKPEYEKIVKDPYVMEFLQIQPDTHVYEGELEQALIDHLQHFLLELGRGFSFVARQKKFTLDGQNFFIDLVFYNYILKCFVLIDLKMGKLTHQDLGQMQMYVNYYTRELMNEGDTPPIGIVLCADKGDSVVKYTLPEDNRQIFASKYLTYLPTEEELKKELRLDDFQKLED